MKQEKILHIKNMVCNRCILAVEDVLDKQQIAFEKVELGKAYLKTDITNTDLQKLSKDLLNIGFEILQDEKSRLLEQIKNEIVRLVHYQDGELQINLSDHLSEKFGKDYSTLSGVFSKETGITLEKYLILQKIERAKELLAYNEMNISEISYLLGYSSVAHFSAQFKKITGYTPSQFRKLERQERRSLDGI